MSSKFVLDSGVAIAWFFPDGEAEQLYAASVLRLIYDSGAVACVPPLFHVEVGAFLMRRRRSKAARFSEVKIAAVLDSLDLLGIKTVVNQDDYRVIVEDARKYHVQGKDAPFIRMADRAGMPFATLDGGQRTAARAWGIPLIGFN